VILLVPEGTGRKNGERKKNGIGTTKDTKKKEKEKEKKKRGRETREKSSGQPSCR
jgi:hypothetical protein